MALSSDTETVKKEISPRALALDFIRWHGAAYESPAPVDEIEALLQRRLGLDVAAVQALLAALVSAKEILWAEFELFEGYVVSASEAAR